MRKRTCWLLAVLGGALALVVMVKYFPTASIWRTYRGLMVPGFDTELEPIAGGHSFSNPVLFEHSPADSETYFVGEREGKILVVRNGKVRDEPFLDITSRVDADYAEQGLLGLAFHPDYGENGRFYVAYTSDAEYDGTSHNVVAEYRRSKQDPYRAEPEESHRLVDIEDPKRQHNGGTLKFGPDGYLYASLGNGGAEQMYKHDGIGQSQQIDNVFGTIMRLDVDNPDGNYAAPGNPFVGRRGDDRIYVYGLRNPWQFDIDSETGDLYIPDVGKKSWEEINFVAADSGGGHNFGWPGFEGSETGPVESAKKAVDTHTEPMLAYEYRSEDAVLADGCSIVGGVMYRGDVYPALKGRFVYGDLCSEDYAALKYDRSGDSGDDVDNKNIRVDENLPIRSIVSDRDGNIYIVSAVRIYRVVDVY